MSLKNLQEKLGLIPDGIFGPTTMNKAMSYFKLTPFRAAHFFGQISHETGGFTIFIENLNYNAQGLKETFPKYFPGNISEIYTRQPEKIANHVYCNRMGNGNEASGDGWRFKGRGAIQTTGRENYMMLAKYLSIPEIMANPDLVATQYAFESALFFFENNNLWSICDQGVDDKSITALTKRINGGILGLDDRKLKTKKYYEYVK
jgi:putative chitinase